ncbi:phage portal protein [Enterococcus casseliflavus]|uniref:phage portal protein n=1 Tax=Enterococcus casseliflavus TaxID=37734 RepID=UPI001BCCCB8E|nr:phage portal protein [Enterococcus casseliflavus]
MGLLLNKAEYRSQDKAVASAIDIISLNDTGILSDFVGETALLQSDIFTAVRIIAGDLASAKYKVDNNDFVEYLLNKKANSATTSTNFLFVLISNIILNGNGFAYIERDKNGKVTGLRNLKSSQVTILESDDGKELGYRVMFADETREVDYEDMIHLKTFTVDGKVGISPLYSLKPELSMLKNGNGLLAGFFKRGVNVGGILKLADSTLNNKQKKEIRQQFEEANAGASNAGSVLVLDSTQDYKQIEVNTKILEMIQNNKYSTQQIAKVFGIPLNRFGMELTNSSDSDQNDVYISSALNQYVKALEQEFTKLHVDVEIDFSDLRDQSPSRLLIRAVEKNGGSGVLTINELRCLYDLPSIDSDIGDQIYINSASVPLK